MARTTSPHARRTCRCGHGAAAHVHFRAGRDCGQCGALVCPAYHPGPRTAGLTQLAAGLCRYARAHLTAAARGARVHFRSSGDREFRATGTLVRVSGHEFATLASG